MVARSLCAVVEEIAVPDVLEIGGPEPSNRPPRPTVARERGVGKRPRQAGDPAGRPRGEAVSGAHQREGRRARAGVKHGRVRALDDSLSIGCRRKQACAGCCGHHQSDDRRDSRNRRSVPLAHSHCLEDSVASGATSLTTCVLLVPVLRSVGALLSRPLSRRAVKQDEPRRVPAAT